MRRLLTGKRWQGGKERNLGGRHCPSVISARRKTGGRDGDSGGKGSGGGHGRQGK